MNESIKEFLFKFVLLSIIVFVIIVAGEYQKKIDIERHKHYLECVARKQMNEMMCSLWVQFHK